MTMTWDSLGVERVGGNGGQGEGGRGRRFRREGEAMRGRERTGRGNE